MRGRAQNLSLTGSLINKTRVFIKVVGDRAKSINAVLSALSPRDMTKVFPRGESNLA